jgi:hypothetical protein
MRKSEIHMHSTYSDGEFSPADLVKIAKRNNVSILSLTDHDTFTGIDEFLRSALAEGICAFPGIEITVCFHDLNLHLLAYFKSAESLLPELRERVEGLKRLREDRMQALIDRVDGVVPERHRGAITFENVRRAAEGVIARPHLAREMVRLGIVASVQEAFDSYLIRHNIEKQNMSAEEAIAMVRRSGGIPVLAHPGERHYSLHDPSVGRGFPEVEASLKELRDLGLLGVECVYPYHERIGKVDYFVKLADALGLIATGSRDFHGFHHSQKTDQLGTTRISDAFLERFEAVWG